MSVRTVLKTIVLIIVAVLLQSPAHAESCKQVAHILNERLSPRVDEQELIEILQTLSTTNNKKLPTQFLTKHQAKERGWRPGKDLWSVGSLKGMSMGGDWFKNREGRLPDGKWGEADLDYKGGHRGGKRLIFSRDGKRFVTVDHYKTFDEVPICR